jgi:exo-1,4-beta-D-glucosaminidase
MNRLVVIKGKDGEEVLPAFWNDNFISLLPGEEKTLTVTMAKEDLNVKKPEIKIDRSGL